MSQRFRSDLATTAELDHATDSDDVIRLPTIVNAGISSQQMANQPDASFEDGLFTSLTDQAPAVFIQHRSTHNSKRPTMRQEPTTDQVSRHIQASPAIGARVRARWGGSLRRTVLLMAGVGLLAVSGLMVAVPASADTAVGGCTIVSNPTSAHHTDCGADQDLPGADLSGADLSGTDLSYANLRQANLTGADLGGATLTNATLPAATLTNATLTGADLTGADLSLADLTGATLTNATLTNAILHAATLTGADLSGADLTDAILYGAYLSGATLTGASAGGVSLVPADVTTTAVSGGPTTESWPLPTLIGATDACTPVSGSVFPAGATTVTCTITPDNDGVAGAGTFTVTVDQTPANTAPANTAPPSLTGQGVVGGVLTCSAGTWAGYPTPTYRYTFLRGSTTVQAASVSATYPVTAADQGGDITCEVTATNTAGTASATSPGVSIPAAAPTAATTVRLSDSHGQPLAGGIVSYYAGGWHTVGTTDNTGTVTEVIPAGSYSFAMTYNGTRQQLNSQAVSATGTGTVAFQTDLVNVELQGSDSNGHVGQVLDLPGNGSASYYAGGWHTITTKNANNPNMVQAEMLPGTYSFAATYNGTRDQEQVTLPASGAATVYFHAALVNVELQGSDSNGHVGQVLELPGNGSASYYAGGWHTITTKNAINPNMVQAEMLPGTYSFAATYNGTRDQKQATIIEPNANNGADADQSVYFHAALVNVQTNATVNGSTSIVAGSASYYAGGWHMISTSDANNPNMVQAEMLPGTYSFADSYNGTRQQKQATIIEPDANGGPPANHADQIIYFGF